MANGYDVARSGFIKSILAVHDLQVLQRSVQDANAKKEALELLLGRPDISPEGFRTIVQALGASGERPLKKGTKNWALGRREAQSPFDAIYNHLMSMPTFGTPARTEQVPKTETFTPPPAQAGTAGAGLERISQPPSAVPAAPPSQFGRTTSSPGLIQPWNIDLRNQPAVRNPDGTVSSVLSMSFEEDGKEILVPRVSDDGRILSNQQAIEQYHRTGKHLGIFRDAVSADRYADQLHNDYAAGRYGAQYGTPGGRADGQFGRISELPLRGQLGGGPLTSAPVTQQIPALGTETRVVQPEVPGLFSAIAVHGQTSTEADKLAALDAEATKLGLTGNRKLQAISGRSFGKITE